MLMLVDSMQRSLHAYHVGRRISRTSGVRTSRTTCQRSLGRKQFAAVNQIPPHRTFLHSSSAKVLLLDCVANKQRRKHAVYVADFLLHGLAWLSKAVRLNAKQPPATTQLPCQCRCKHCKLFGRGKPGARVRMPKASRFHKELGSLQRFCPNTMVHSTQTIRPCLMVGEQRIISSFEDTRFLNAWVHGLWA